MKKIILYVFLTVVFSALIIYLLSPKRQKDASNGFNRKIRSVNIKFMNAMEITNTSAGLIGKLDDKLRLQFYGDETNVYQTGHNLAGIDTVPINFPLSFDRTAKNIYKDFLSQYIFCSNLYGDISIINGSTSRSYKFKDARMDIFQAVSPNTIIGRTLYKPSTLYKQDSKGNRSLSKLSLSDTLKLEKEYRLPELINGFFTNDGMLLYNAKKSKVLYVYYYRGEFLCLDSNLKKQYISKTIDTVQAALVDFSIKPFKKPVAINAYVTTDNNLVYICTRLKAENETAEEYDNNQPIDVYDINDGKYIYSFHIPKYRHQKLKQFQIKGGTLMALFGSFIVTYKFNPL